MTAKQKVRDAVLALIRAQIEATDGSSPGGRNMLQLGDSAQGEGTALCFGYGYFDGDSVMIYRGDEIVLNDHPAEAGGTDWEFSPEQAADYFADQLFGPEVKP